VIGNRGQVKKEHKYIAPAPYYLESNAVKHSYSPLPITYYLRCRRLDAYEYEIEKWSKQYGGNKNI
jgi:hypothetical protein